MIKSLRLLLPIFFLVLVFCPKSDAQQYCQNNNLQCDEYVINCIKMSLASQIENLKDDVQDYRRYLVKIQSNINQVDAEIALLNALRLNLGNQINPSAVWVALKESAINLAGGKLANGAISAVRKVGSNVNRVCKTVCTKIRETVRKTQFIEKKVGLKTLNAVDKSSSEINKICESDERLNEIFDVISGGWGETVRCVSRVVVLRSIDDVLREHHSMKNMLVVRKLDAIRHIRDLKKQIHNLEIMLKDVQCHSDN